MSRDCSDPSSSRAIWLALRTFSSRLPELRARLRDLEACLAGAALPGADLYYRTRTDTALVRLRADPALLTSRHLARLGRRASRAGISILDPKVSSIGMHTRLSSTYMCSYEVRFLDMPSAAEGTRLLAEYLGALPARARQRFSATRPPPLGLRFRSSDCWRPGRVRSLTLQSIAVAAERPPRKDERVEIELAATGLDVVLSARVLAVTPPYAAQITGAHGFGARFVDIDARSKARLKRVLAIAEEQHALDERPPARRHRRYAVHWPIEIGIEGPDTLVPALDISQQGLFVAYGTPVPPGTPLGVSIPLEVTEAPLRAGARVARVLAPKQAALRRVPPGIGLELTVMETKAAERFADLLDRVARRSSRCVLVCAGADRLPKLGAALSAVGYAVSGVSDSAALIGRSAARSPIADLALIDRSFDVARPGELAIVQRHLELRGTPTVRLLDHQPSDAWKLADAVLLGRRSED